MGESPQVVWHNQSVVRPRGCVVWFTGLSGSGKSTIANCLDMRLYELGVPCMLLDGDNVRHGLNASPQRLQADYGESFAQRFGLGFSAEDRAENVRRVGCVAELFCSAGLVALTALVSPWRSDRDRVRRHVESSGAAGDFIEVFVDTPLEICEARDPKGLYRQARAGTLTGMTGIDDPYEAPMQPELTLDGGRGQPDQLARQVLDYLEFRGRLDAVRRGPEKK
jgi:adenylylsulfate kinase